MAEILDVLAPVYDVDVRYDRAILVHGAAPLAQRAPLRPRPGMARRVTVDELAAMLRDALPEAERRVREEAERALRRERGDRARESVLVEDVRSDQERLLARLADAGGTAALRDLIEPKSREELVGAMQAVLHLAAAGRVRLEQTAFPTGPVLVVKK